MFRAHSAKPGACHAEGWWWKELTNGLGAGPVCYQVGGVLTQIAVHSSVSEGLTYQCGVVDA